MATIQSKKSRGYKYWYIVESRRVNGKPRPIVLEYLGTAQNLLNRLRGITDNYKIKSYSHGAVSALLKIANKLDVVEIINKYIQASRPYISEKPIRNNLTAGITLLLGAIGRACMPTSKRGWWTWAKTTSLEYLLRCSLSKIDSQHFWDLMDCVPVENIPKIEEELLQTLYEIYNIESNTLFFDTTNFYTYIHTTNERCKIAQRGKNKQKRNDLRQIGLALVTTKKDFIPLFHYTYQGNIHDSVIFKEVIEKIKERLQRLNLDIEKHTLVFDRGNNSKKNLTIFKRWGLFYIGALTPYHHKDLVETAIDNFKTIEIDGNKLDIYRDKKVIWGEERTVVVFISDKLKAGQIRGIYQSLAKAEKKLIELGKNLLNPKGKKREKEKLEKQITTIINVQYVKDIIKPELKEVRAGRFELEVKIDDKKLQEIEDNLGFRIIMTNRHNWETGEIIKAYHGQSIIERVFKELKNPYHLAIDPQFHWTDQKIIVHNFICVLGYLLSTLVWREAKVIPNIWGSLDTLLDTLENIRLAVMLEQKGTQGKLKAIYKLEEMSQEEHQLMKQLELLEFHEKRPKFKNVSVYN